MVGRRPQCRTHHLHSHSGPHRLYPRLMVACCRLVLRRPAVQIWAAQIMVVQIWAAQIMVVQIWAAQMMAVQMMAVQIMVVQIWAVLVGSSRRGTEATRAGRSSRSSPACRLSPAWCRSPAWRLCRMAWHSSLERRRSPAWRLCKVAWHSSLGLHSLGTVRSSSWGCSVRRRFHHPWAVA